MSKLNRRVVYLGCLVVTIGCGLFSRTAYIPSMIYPYIGDVFYALMMYWIFALLFPNNQRLKLWIYAVGLCILIECSQLYQADWLNAIRHTRLGGLVLGFGFLWSDLICYALGGILGFLFDGIFRARVFKH